MPTQLTIPVRPQFGVGQFETLSAFDGYKSLRFAWSNSFGILLPQLDEGFTGLGGGSLIWPVPVPGNPANAFSAAGQITLANLGKGLTNTQHAATDHYVQRALVWDGVATAVEQIAADVHATKKAARRWTKPREVIRYIKPNVKAQLAPYVKRTAEAEARATLAERRAAELEQRVSALERKVSKPHSIAVPGLPGRIGEVEREVDRLKGRVGKISKWLALGLLLANLAKVLEKMGVNYVRCSKMKKLGKGVCGMDDSWLDSLLNDALLVVGTISLVELAKSMQPEMSATARLVRWFWRVA